MPDDIHQAVFPIVGQIHEDRDARGKLDEFLLNLLALAFVFLFLFRQFLPLLRCHFAWVFRLLGLLDMFRLIDDGLNVSVQTAEAFNAHQRLHGLRVIQQSLEGSIVYIH